MELMSEQISEAEWDLIAAVPIISKLKSLPPEHAGRVLEDRVVGMKVSAMEGLDHVGDVFVLYAEVNFTWLAHRPRGCKCSHLHVAFQPL
jgi:hypothetical protein